MTGRTGAELLTASVRLALVLLGVATALSVIAPRGAFLFLALSLLTLPFIHRPRALIPATVPQAAAAWLGFAAYAMLSAAWAASPLETLLHTPLLAVAAALATLAVYWAGETPSPYMGRVRIALLAGVLVGLGFLAVECATGLRLTRAVLNVIPLFRPDSDKHFWVAGERILHVGDWTLNRSLTVFTLFLWPALLVIAGTRAALWRGALLLAGGIVIFAWVHESSKLAFALGLAMFLIAGWKPRLGNYAAIAGWATAVLLVIPVTMGLYRADLHKAEWLPLSARARIVLWNHTSESVFESPVIGIGARSTKVEMQQRDSNPVQPEGFPYPIQTGRHAHNVFLQTWYELGAVGAALLLLAGLATIRAVDRLPRRTRPAGLAAFAAATGMASTSYGLWQSWFLGAMAMTAVLLALAARSRAGMEKPPAGR